MQTATHPSVMTALPKSEAYELPYGSYFPETVSFKVLVLLACLLLSEAVMGETYYVKTSGSDANDGKSWATAFQTVQQSLSAAVGGDQIWVAAGTYSPTADASGNSNPINPRNKTFVMKNGVAIYGGFAGTETDLSQRNWKTHVTTLSGDLNSDDVVSGSGNTLSISDNGENSYHVIKNYQNGLNSSAVLDGFTITGGNANADDFGETSTGGGMVNSASSPAITNCSFTGNNSAYLGGGMMNSSSSSPTITNCSFSRNHTDFAGGGMDNHNYCSPTITNCIFSGNYAGESGGGMYSYYNCSPLLTNCSFSGNYAVYYGGGMHNATVSPTVTNCIFWNNNSGRNNNGGIYNIYTNLTLTYSIVQGGYPGTGNNNQDPLFVDAAGGNLRLQACSPAIDAGNNAANTSSTDLDGNTRINHTTIDMGAYEYYGTLYAYYTDADGDGYGATTAAGQTSFCSTAPAGYSANNADCNDADANEHPDQTWYIDNDGDRYASSSTTACARPTNGKLASELTGSETDCDDGNAAINPNTVWVKDSDGDGYYSGIATQCTSPRAEYIIKTNQQAGDCDDNSSAINPNTVWVKDGDGDGYYTDSPVIQCIAPGTGYVIEVSQQNGDCDDGNAAINPNTVWVKDVDGDGYYTGSPVTQCSSPGAGYVIKNNQQAEDCNDNDPAVHSPITYYRDVDGDGYGSSVSAPFCSSTAPAGYSARTGDLKDNDPAISPGAVEVCGNNVDDNCNGVVDEKTCYACQNGTSLTTTSITSNSAQLNWNATANPQQWQLEYKTIASGSKWTDVLLTGNIRSVKISSLKANQTYNWHIRAKCNGTWTAYSSSAVFKTAGSISSSIITSAIAANNSTLSLYPNPTKGQFVVELNVGDKINTNAKIQLVDLTGRTVQTENAEINYGSLKQPMNMLSTLAKGIYIVRIMANGRVYTAKLVYEK